MRVHRFVSLISTAAIACGGSNHSNPVDAAADSSTADAGSGSGSGSGSGTPMDVTVTFSNPPSVPADFAFIVGYEDGNGAWQDAPAPSGGTFKLPITSATYGVVYTCIGGPKGTGSGGGGSGSGATGIDKDVFLGLFATAERPSLTITLPARCTDPVATSHLTGAISGLTNAATGTTSVFASTASTVVAQTLLSDGNYALDVVPGTYDIVAVHVAGAGGGVGSGSDVPDKILVVRDVAVGAGAATQNLSFAGASAPATATVTVSAAGSATVVATTELATADATDAVMIDQVGTGSGGALKAVSLAAGDGLATDVYAQRLVVTGTGAGGPLEVTAFTAAATAQIYTAPAAFGGVLTSVPTTTPYPELKLAWSVYANAVGYAASAHQGCAANSNCVTWTVAESATYAGASPVFQMPDLTGLTGWDSRLQFNASAQIAGAIDAETSTAGASDFGGPALPAAGTTRTNAEFGFTQAP